MPKRLFSTFSCLICAAAMFALSSCGSSGADERNHPLFIKAKNLKEKGKFAESARIFSEYLKINPDSAKTHYELAILYDDHLEDSLLAVYHYRSFLEHSPADFQEREIVETWLKAAEKKYFEKLKLSFPDTALNDEIESLKAREKRYIAHLNQLIKENSYLKSQSGAAAPAPHAAPSGGAAPVREQTQEQPSDASAPQEGETPEYYVVQKGDNLMKISRRLYGDTKYYKIILDANKDVISSESQIQVGQKLRIPKLP